MLLTQALGAWGGWVGPPVCLHVYQLLPPLLLLHRASSLLPCGGTLLSFSSCTPLLFCGSLVVRPTRVQARSMLCCALHGHPLWLLPYSSRPLRPFHATCSQVPRRWLLTDSTPCCLLSSHSTLCLFSSVLWVPVGLERHQFITCCSQVLRRSPCSPPLLPLKPGGTAGAALLSSACRGVQ